MRKLTLFFLFPLFLLSYTGIGGGRGHFFVQDALTQGPGFLTLSLHTLSRRQKPETTNFFYTDMPLAITYSPIDYFELSGSGGGIFLDYPFKNFTYSWHDWNLKGKLVLPLIKVFKPGFILGYNFPRDTIYDPLGLAVKKGLEYTGAVNLKFSDLFPSLPSLLLNMGRYQDNLDSAHTYFGASLELATKGLLFFGEYYKVGETSRLTPGIKLLSPNFSFDIGWSFLFLQDVRRNQLLIGFTYLTPFLRVTIPTGRIAGKVLSASTNEPIPATISFPENPKLKPINNDPNTGLYSAAKIPEGTIVVEVFSEGYFKEYLPITVKKDMTITQDFYLKPVKVFGQLAGRVYEANTGKPLAARLSFPNTDLPPVLSDSTTGAFRLTEVPTGTVAIEAEKEGYFKYSVSATIRENELTSIEIPLSPSFLASVVTGKVSDRKTGEPIAAEIIFEGASIPPIKTDPKTGIYRTELPVGAYTAMVKAENYITQSLPVIVEKDKVTEKNFSLVSVGMTITLKVLFDFNKATIKSESYRGLDEAAQILKDNPKISVEIQGHTDNIGSDAYNQKLSERRAQAVANYFISQHGIDANRLRTKGYGESKPIAPNDTEEGRALNRRVEFVVIREE